MTLSLYASVSWLLWLVEQFKLSPTGTGTGTGTRNGIVALGYLVWVEVRLWGCTGTRVARRVTWRESVCVGVFVRRLDAGRGRRRRGRIRERR